MNQMNIFTTNILHYILQLNIQNIIVIFMHLLNLTTYLEKLLITYYIM